jgi:hypothetical protein
MVESIERLSTEAIRRELRGRATAAKKLLAERARLLARLDEIEASLSGLDLPESIREKRRCPQCRRDVETFCTIMTQRLHEFSRRPRRRKPPEPLTVGHIREAMAKLAILGAEPSEGFPA